MAEHVDAREGAPDLLPAQDGGEGLHPLGLGEADGGPVPPEGLLVEELDPTQGDGAGDAGPAAHIGAVEEVQPELLLRDQVGRLRVVVGQFTDRAGIGLLGPGGEAPQLHVLDHPLAERAHSGPPLVGETPTRTPPGGLLCVNSCRE